MAQAINDGFTFRGFIEEVPGLHGPLRLRYRPALVEEGSEFYEQAAKLKARQADQHTAKFLKSKLVDWDAKWPEPQDPLTSVLNPKPGTEAGQSAELTAANVLHLKRVVFQRLLGIVLGSQPADPDPSLSLEGQADPAVPQLEQLTTAAGNSSAG